MPSAAYIVAGELTLERKRDGKKQRFTAGQAVSETVDTLHRGVAGSEPVVLTSTPGAQACLSLGIRTIDRFLQRPKSSTIEPAV
jgi:hypothetical protein